MRSTMPDTADWVARKRLDWGKEHVNDCLRRATVEKQPGQWSRPSAPAPASLENCPTLGVRPN